MAIISPQVSDCQRRLIFFPGVCITEIVLITAGARANCMTVAYAGHRRKRGGYVGGLSAIVTGDIILSLLLQGFVGDTGLLDVTRLRGCEGGRLSIVLRLRRGTASKSAVDGAIGPGGAHRGLLAHDTEPIVPRCALIMTAPSFAAAHLTCRWAGSPWTRWWYVFYGGCCQWYLVFLVVVGLKKRFRLCNSRQVVVALVFCDKVKIDLIGGFCMTCSLLLFRQGASHSLWRRVLLRLVGRMLDSSSGGGQ